MSVTMQQVRETLDQALAKTRVRGVVREPVMVTLPLATLAAAVIYEAPGGAWSSSFLGALVAAVVVSLAIYAIDLNTLTEEEKSDRKTYLYRLGYMLLNALILLGVLRGLISPEQIGLGTQK